MDTSWAAGGVVPISRWPKKKPGICSGIEIFQSLRLSLKPFILRALKMNAWTSLEDNSFPWPGLFSGSMFVSFRASLWSLRLGLIHQNAGFRKREKCMSWMVDVFFRTIIFCWWIFWLQNHPTIEGLNAFFRWYKLKFHVKSPEFSVKRFPAANPALNDKSMGTEGNQRWRTGASTAASASFSFMCLGSIWFPAFRGNVAIEGLFV